MSSGKELISLFARCLCLASKNIYRQRDLAHIRHALLVGQHLNASASLPVLRVPSGHDQNQSVARLVDKIQLWGNI